jgi:uncharacterized membrane protein YbhN (UPF0104 family)
MSVKPDLSLRRLLRRKPVEFFAGYFWFIFKNVIGWILILSSVPVGFTFPGPGGLPLFLIGFALVTFPGKRQLTSRVMRGRGLPIEAEVFTFLTAFFAIAGTCVLMWFIADRVDNLLKDVHLDPRQQQATYTAIFTALLITGLFALGMTWLVMRLSLKVLNYVLRGMPFIRRKMRPWMRKRGMILLPSRRHGSPSEQIIQLEEEQQDRLRIVGAELLRWFKRMLGVAITVAIFVWILRPIVQKWPNVRERVLDTSIPRFIFAAGMFAIFLFAFRALAWRKIVASFGYHLPIAAAVRIWSTSELARYVPGSILQVMGRIYLIRPYGVSGGVCSITQILELAIFLVANILVAVSCLLYFGIKNMEHGARGWLFGIALLLPILAVLLHPKIFYGIINTALRRLGKPAIVQRLRGKMLIAILFWNIFGLLWQTLAIFLIVQQPLGLKWDWWWIVAGAYCLAWCAGFLAFWAPGGLGMREVVFIGAMWVILPPQLQKSSVILAFLSVLLRLWATTGELLLAMIAYAIDFRGAIGLPNAPGRVEMTHPISRDIDAAA